MNASEVSLGLVITALPLGFLDAFLLAAAQELWR